MVYYDICKHLHRRGYIVDIINWQVNHADYMGELINYYDLVISALDGVRTLVEVYGVPADKLIGLSHHALDIRILIGQMGVDVFERLAGYGVVGYQLFDASAVFGVKRHPLVVHLGVNFDEFRADIPERLATVGYAGSFSHKTIDGIEIKRGELAEAAAHEAGLAFKVAGSTADQVSFHDMPGFYKSVDVVLVSSVTEGAGLPVREGAAAGRLVISTPVGDFPLRAAQGIGIIAPIESDKYRNFVAATLKHYKDNPAAFVEMCRKTQDAARQLDWPNMIGDWVELIETAAAGRAKLEHATSPSGVTAGLEPYFRARETDYRHRGVNYLDFLGALSASLAPTSYLEIGTNAGASLSRFSCDAICIDPEFKCQHSPIGPRKRALFFQMGSDEFFDRHAMHAIFPEGLDIAFLDGMHHFEFLLRDLMHTERWCHERSLILLHDCLPVNFRMTDRDWLADEQEDSSTRGWWTGDVWRLLPALQRYRPDLRVLFLDCPPTGLVVIDNLDPHSDVLRRSYEAIVDEFLSIELSFYGLHKLWSLFPTLDSRKIIANHAIQSIFQLR